MTTLRNCILTCWCDDITQEQVKAELLLYQATKHFVIGAVETTESDNDNVMKDHFHVYIEFSRPVHFEALKKMFKSSHIEKRNTTRINCVKYCVKNGEFINTFPESTDELDDNDISSCIIDDLENGLHLYQIIRKYPKFCIYRIENLKQLKIIYEDYCELLKKRAIDLK